MLDLVILVLAGFAAGLLNAVAGGGTFLTLPALIYVGVPPVSANATATLSALPGYIASSFAFRRDMRAEGRLGLPAIVGTAAIGGAVGGILLILTPGSTFLAIAPWLLLMSTCLFATGPWLLGRMRAHGMPSAGPAVSAVAIFIVGVYGGYFNGGLGIVLLATFGLLGHVNLHGMNGLKNVLSALLSLVSAVTFILAGIVSWEPAIATAASCALGGYVGACQTRRIKRLDLLRTFITAVGAAMTFVFFLRL